MSHEGEATEQGAVEGHEELSVPLVPRRPLRISDDPGVSLRSSIPVVPAPGEAEAPAEALVKSDAPPPPGIEDFAPEPELAAPPAPPVFESETAPQSFEVAPADEVTPFADVENKLATLSVPAEEIDDSFVEEADPTPVLNRAAEIVSLPPPSLDVAPASELTMEETLALLEEEDAAVEVEPESPAPPVIERKPPPPQRSTRPALPTASQPRKKPWWEEVFGDDFSRGHRPLGEEATRSEVDFIVSQLAPRQGAVVLDLCCGQGEISVALNSRGLSVVGYDLSVFQLAMAGDAAQAAKQKINFLQGDMREMAFESMFDSVVCWDTSFGYFEEDKNVEVARRIWSALKPGGSLLLDVMNRDHVAMNSPHNHWFEGDGCICMDDMQMDWITSRLRVKRSIILDDGRSKEITFSIRLYTLSEIGKLLHSVGFRVVSVSGHPATPGAFLGPQSPRIIIRAERPEE